MTVAEDTWVEEYMALPYRVEIYWDEDYWAAEFPELPALAAAGDTLEELARKIDDSKRSYFMSMLERGQPIRRPGAEANSQLRLRLPRSLHRQATRAAQRDGVSLNTWLVAAVAKELGRKEAAR